MSSAGLAAQPFGQDDLLLVAARQGGYRVGEPAVPQPQPLGPVGGERALGAGPDEAALPQPGQRGERHVLLDRHVHDQALLAPVLRHVADPGRHRGRGRPLAEFRAADGHLSGVVAVDPEDGPRHLAAARAHQARQRDDLPRPHVQRDVDEHSLPGQALHPQHLVPGLAAFPGRALRHVPAHHGAHQVVGGQAGQLAGQHRSAVAHHGDALADLEDLLQPVRDEQHRGPGRPQRADHVEKPCDLGGGQRGGRLVHHDDPGLKRERLGDLHDLLVGDGQPAGDPARVELDAQPLEQGSGLRPHEPAVDAPGGQQRLAPHEDVLGHREVGEQGWFLIDDGDAGRLGGGRPGEDGGLALDEQLALIRLVHPGQHLHHRRLAGPVLPHQGVRLTAVEVDRGVHDRAHRAECLRGMHQREQGLAQGWRAKCAGRPRRAR